MPSGSTIVVTVGGVDITNKVLFATARFESQLGAIPGTAELVVKDVDQTLDFTTGDELTLDIDGDRQWGGYVVNVQRQFAFPAVDTSVPGDVTARQWMLSGIDYNILFDKRIIHNSADHTHHLPFFTLDQTMGDLLRDVLFANYLDISGDGLNTTTYVDDVYVPRFDANGDPDPDATKQGSWPQQGSTWRKAMDDFAQYGAIYYIDANKNVHFHAVETTLADWKFSDVPNNLPLPNSSATYGMREFEAVEDSSAMANDAMVWGGSEWAGPTGGTVFARAQNTTSINEHHRWQYAETRFGELKTQGMVNARANVISSGSTTGAVGGDTARGLAVDQRQVRLAWFAHDVPLLSGNKAHLRAGDVVTMHLYVLSEDEINPLVITLPLRSIKISFPTLDSTSGDGYVRFDGFFGVQLSDPWWLWKFLRDNAQGAVRGVTVIATADGSTTSAIYGTLGSFEPTPTPNGSVTTFAIPFAYIDGSTNVYKNGLLQTPDVDYTESTPEQGEISFTSPPASGAELWVICRLAGGYS